jgi:hypothetical protein
VDPFVDASVVVVDDSQGTIVIDDSQGTVVNVGTPGPPGPAGAGALNRVEMSPEQFGALGDPTDDTAAFQAMVDAAYALGGGVDIRLGGKTYLLNGDPRTDRYGRSVLSVTSAPWDSKSLTFIGIPGRTVLKTTRNTTADQYSGTYGSASLIGAATRENPAAVAAGAGLYCGPLRMRDVGISIPNDSPLAGIDGHTIGGISLHGVGINYVGSSDHIHTYPGAFGIRFPNIWDFGLVEAINCGVSMAYAAYVITTGDHIRLDACNGYKCRTVLGFEASGAPVGDPPGFSHAIASNYVMAEHSNYALSGWSLLGAGSLPANADPIYFQELNVDIEQGQGLEPAAFNQLATVLDANNRLFGNLNVHSLGALGVSGNAGTITGGTNLKVSVANKGCPSVASQSSITLPSGQDTVKLTGTNAVSTIAAADIGSRKTLIFTSTASLTTGGNITFNFSGSTNAAITIVCDGTSWYKA